MPPEPQLHAGRLRVRRRGGGLPAPSRRRPPRLSPWPAGSCRRAARPRRDRVLHVPDERLFQAGGARARRSASAASSHASTLPAFISEMRSQRIPSFMKCVVTKIVTPCLRDRSDQQLPEAVARDRIDARRRLVEDQDLRLVQHGDRQRQPLRRPIGSASASASTCGPSPNRSTSSSMRAFALSGGR